MTKKLAIIGASYLQLPLIEKAKNIGLETHVFAWKADDVGEKAADYFYPISIVEKDKILEKCKDLKVDGVCSIGSDLANITVNYISENMGLIGNSLHSTSISTNKNLMRETFYINGDPIPKFACCDSNSDLSKINMGYPLIAKPTDRSGSRGVYKVENQYDLENAVKKALEVSFDKKVMIEEYVEGQEYSVEYISWKGQHHFLALTKKITTGAPYFIEKEHIEPADVSDELLVAIKKVVEHALDSLEIKYGASHSEIKISDKNEIKIIEIGGRMGGDCIGSDLVYYSTGIDFVKGVIDVSLGNEPDLSRKREPIKVKIVYMFTKEDFDKFENIKKNNPNQILKIVDYHPEKIGTTTDSSNRCGCYIIQIQ